MDDGARVHGSDEFDRNEQFTLALCLAGDDSRKVLTLTEPQQWTLIGVFGAYIFGIQGIAISSFGREMQSIRNELITRMDSRFD